MNSVGTVLARSEVIRILREQANQITDPKIKADAQKYLDKLIRPGLELK